MALVLSFSLSFQFSWADTVDDVSAPDLSHIAEPEFDPSIDYFCVEHLQPLIAAEDLEPGQEQICLGCHPEYLDMQSIPYAENATPLFPSGVAVANSLSGEWSNCPTLVGQDQTILYKVYFVDTVNRYGTFYLRLVFSGSVQSLPYFNFSSDSEYWTERHDIPGTWNNFEAGFNFTSSVGSVSLAAMGSVNNGYYPVSVPFKGSAVSGNTLYAQCQSYDALASSSYFRPDIKVNMGSFAFSSEQFGGTVGGPGGGQVTPPEPEPPGWDSPDGWLGGLINSIIEGIRELIDGISNIAGNIAKLPGLIADALRSMLNAIKNAITAIGNQISSAIEALGNFLIEGLKSLFIPSEGYFEGKANEMRTWLEQHLGLLVYPFTLVADLADRVAGLQNGEPVVHVPEIAYIQDNVKYVLIAEQDVNIYDQVNRKQIFLDIHKYYLMAMDAAIAMALVVLAWKKFDQITGGRDT